MDATVAIRVVDLTKSFGSLRVLDCISFTVRRGEIFGYLGPNGAGKTTTIKILCGLLRRDAGEVSVAGVDIEAEPVLVKQRIGVVPDESNLYPELSCRRNLEYLGELYGLGKALRQTRRAELLEEFSLVDKADTPFGALSRGMKRRLTIAAALMHDPEILFLDEPTTGLDVPSAKGLRQLIQKINRSQNVTVFLTTHNLYEAEALCHHILILQEGQALAEGTAPEIRQQVDRLKTLEVAFDREVTPDWWIGLGIDTRPPTPVNGKWRLEIPGPEVHRTLKQLLAWSESAGVRLIDLSTSGANLEEAFLAILKEKSQTGVKSP